MRRATIVGFAVVALLLALLPAAALAQYGGSAQSSAPAPAAPAAVAPAQASGPAPAQSAEPAPAPAPAQPAAPPPQAAPAAQPTSAPTRMPRGGGSPTSTLPIAGLLAPGLVVGGLLLRRRSGRVAGLGALALALALFAPAASGLAAPASARPPAQVVVPEEDRFAPFALTIHAGQSVERIHRDTDDH